MTENGVISHTKAAETLDVRKGTITDLVRALGIRPKPMTNGKAKGLDAGDMRRLRKALGKSACAAAAS